MLAVEMTRRDMLLGSLILALKRGRLDEAVGIIEGQIDSRQLSAATLVVHDHSAVEVRAFGKALNAGAVFLLASLTKPMTASTVMILVDRKQVSLTDRVRKFIPEFRGDGREQVLVKHLLTHTSGLPDMLPNNEALRKQHAPLSEFVAFTCRTPLLFVPGSQWRYQSMGILLAGEIVSRVSGEALPDFLREHVYRPLGMSKSSLGLGGRSVSETMLCQLDEKNDWDWNSSYWRNLASPWGGAHASGPDVARFLRYFSHPSDGVLKPETALAMVTTQTAGLQRRWGLGWMLNNGTFGRSCSPHTFGHEGSTGTLCWCDPKRALSFVLLTTRPSAHSSKTLLSSVSEAVSEGA